MGKILIYKQNRFDGGIANDIRAGKPNQAQLVKYFDILSHPSSLRPHNSSESGNTTPTTEIQRFLFANSLLYGYGVIDGDSTSVQIYTKSDFSGGAWNTLGSSSTATVTPDFNLFVAYKYGGTLYLFGARGSGGTGAIWRNTPGSAFDDNHQALSFTTINQGIVHSKDNILYIPYDNIIAKNNAGTWNTTALTLTADYLCSSICEYGNFLAIGCSAAATAGRPHSRVFLWDRDSTVSTLTESIEVGPEILMALHEYEGSLISIGYLGKRVIARQYQGAAGFVKIAEIRSTAVATAIINRHSQKANGRIYFLANLTIDGTQHEGVWSFGRSLNGEMAFSFDRTANNDTDVSSLQSFHFETVSGIDYMFVAYTDNSSNEQVSKTSETSTDFTASSVWESTIINFDDASAKKKLLAVTVIHEPLPTAGSVTLKYKADADSSWTTIYTHTTDDSISHSAINIESSGATLPEFKELRLQITSTGGAVINGIKALAEITGKDIYSV